MCDDNANESVSLQYETFALKKPSKFKRIPLDAKVVKVFNPRKRKLSPYPDKTKRKDFEKIHLSVVGTSVSTSSNGHNFQPNSAIQNVDDDTEKYLTKSTKKRKSIPSVSCTQDSIDKADKPSGGILASDSEKLVDNAFFDTPSVQHVMAGDYGDEIVVNLYPTADTATSTAKNNEVINENKSFFSKLPDDQDNAIYLPQTYNSAGEETSQGKNIDPTSDGTNVMYGAMNLESDANSKNLVPDIIEIESDAVATWPAKKALPSERRTTLPASAAHIDDPVRNVWITTKEHKDQLKENGLTWETGMWSKKEIEILKRNIDNYCQKRGIKDPSYIIFDATKDERKDFYPTISLGLQRPVFAVYRRVKRMYNKENHKGRYSREEIEKLKVLKQRYGSDWRSIAQEMGRSSDSVKDRCRLIKDERSSGKWSPEEEQRLASAVYEVTNSKYGQSVTEGIPWVKVACLVKSRTEKQCRTKWLHFLNWKLVRGREWTKEDDKLLVEKIFRLNPQTENEINWNKLTSGWPSARSPCWLHKKWSELKKMLNECDLDFPDTVKLLNKLFTEEIFKIWDRPKQMVKFLIGQHKEKSKSGVTGKKILRMPKKLPPSSADTGRITTSVISQSDETATAPLFIQTTDPDQLVTSDIMDLQESDESKQNFDLSTTSGDYICETSSDSLNLPQGTYHLTPTSSDGIFIIYTADNAASEDLSLANNDGRVVNITLAPEVLNSMLKLDGGGRNDDAQEIALDAADEADNVYLSQSSTDNPILSSVARDVTIDSHSNDEDTCLFVT